MHAGVAHKGHGARTHFDAPLTRPSHALRRSAGAPVMRSQPRHVDRESRAGRQSSRLRDQVMIARMLDVGRMEIRSQSTAEGVTEHVLEDAGAAGGSNLNTAYPAARMHHVQCFVPRPLCPFSSTFSQGSPRSADRNLARCPPRGHCYLRGANSRPRSILKGRPELL